MNSDFPYPRVVRVTSLKSFLTEVSTPLDASLAKPVVRLTNRLAEGEHSAALLLSVQGVNAAGEVVWLCEAHTISWLYGKPFGAAAESVYTGMRELEGIVRAHLESLAYDVRDGDYGLPDDIKALGAAFECAKWVRLSEYQWQVRAVTETVGATSTVEATKTVEAPASDPAQSPT